MRPTVDTSRLYDETLDADLDGIRKLADHAARNIFSSALAEPGGLRTSTFLGPAIADDAPADLAAITRRGFRKGLLDYLVETGRVAMDDDGTVLALPGLAISAAEQAQASALASANATFADVRELLGVLERRAPDLLRGVDGIAILRDTLGFEQMQVLWERLTLQLPQRLVERTLGAELMLDRLSQQQTGVTVLECGAGVGSVLRRALELPDFLGALDALERYVYTDINPFLVEWSKDWFRRNAPRTLVDRMEFKVLNLDGIGGPGAPEASSIDLVLLDDVAHDVVDLQATLEGLGRLLTADGWLAMTENFRQPPGDFMFIEIFPMTFHSYNKARLRPGTRESRGFMTLPEWRASLAAAGFGEVHVFPDPQHHRRWPMGSIVALRRP